VQTNGANAYGEVVWFWHPLLMSSRQRFCEPNRVSLNRKSVGDGDKKEFVAGKSTKETVKTIARGKPGDFRRNRGDYRVLTTNAHGLRVLRAPGFPCALSIFWANDFRKARARRAARSRTHVFSGCLKIELERFRAKWIPVRVKKTRQNKRLERGSDSIRNDQALEDALMSFRA
jgi:hypothetical protein